MKRYLLVAGDHYYPRSGDGDWIAAFETYEEAFSLIEDARDKPGIGDYIINYPLGAKVRCDWFEIIDLSNWIL